MAKKSKIQKWIKEKENPKFTTRYRNRCRRCGRPRG
ncbi:MAG: type Z 30S ribosomal protein S14, partial [Candidatus Omnitrophica bacterium]|nr:type Z 30S ribosomal protein S14 [Candidatus Omnitrophota bacterium]